MWSLIFTEFVQMKTNVICFVPAQIPYLQKFLLLGYGSKCSQPIRLQDLLINQSPEQIGEIARFFAC